MQDFLITKKVATSKRIGIVRRIIQQCPLSAKKETENEVKFAHHKNQVYNLQSTTEGEWEISKSDENKFSLDERKGLQYYLRNLRKADLFLTKRFF